MQTKFLRKSAYELTFNRSTILLILLYIGLSYHVILLSNINVILLNILYMILIIFRIWIFSIKSKFETNISCANGGLKSIDEVRNRQAQITYNKYIELQSQDLPQYTILIALYKEANMVSLCFQRISSLIYPTEKLQVLVVLEADDLATINAIQNLNLPLWWEPVIVPTSIPRTKSKACNYALQFARGTLLVIYDAEDAPEPEQLLKAVHKFNNSHAVCLQAKLAYYNTQDNWLTRFFAIEYELLFGFSLPAIERLLGPIPLGGSSNHFYVSILKEYRGWDSYNVTEDAELGIYLSLNGAKIEMLDSYTYEEAPLTIIPWIKQRARWIKGHIITYILYYRYFCFSPLLVKHKILFHLFFGLPSIVLGISGIMLINMMYHQHLNYLSLLIFIFYYFSNTYQAIYIIHSKGNIGAIYALLYPLYFILHIIAGLVAIIELIISPYRWNKTTHGHAIHNDIYSLHFKS